MLRIFQQVYNDYPNECNIIMDTSLSLIGALWTFVGLPIGDLLLGQDTFGRAEVRLIISTPAHNPCPPGITGCRFI